MSPNTKKPSVTQSTQPSYSFHGSNSSHSKDNGSGGRTYHIPNYATSNSYANEKSNLISVSFDEDKASSNAILKAVVMFLLFAAIPLSIMAWKPSVLHQDEAQVRSCPPNTVALVHSSGGYNEELSDPKSVYGEQSRLQKARSSGKFFWDEPQPSARCISYRKREYTANLRNVPFHSNGIEACENTEVSINGVVLTSPSFCESKWPFGGVIGHWIVDSGEECSAHWGRVSDKGCLEPKSKLRRFQAQLHSLKKAEDWLTICNTAPVTIQGISILKPTVCENQGFWGIYGTWDLEDPNC